MGAERVRQKLRGDWLPRLLAVVKPCPAGYPGVLRLLAFDNDNQVDQLAGNAAANRTLADKQRAGYQAPARKLGHRHNVTLTRLPRRVVSIGQTLPDEKSGLAKSLRGRVFECIPLILKPSPDLDLKRGVVLILCPRHVVIRPSNRATNRRFPDPPPTLSSTSDRF